jgi:1,4-dihydroxy-2-naphthoate octaprenyltransferase
MSLSVWFCETRPQFLALSVVLAILGGALSASLGAFHLGHTLLAGFGLLFLHVSVNVLNDYFDFRSGLDLRTQRTPFSGGSGVLPQGLMRPGQALGLGLAAFALAVPIGAYFVWAKGLALLPLLVLGAVAVFFYTTCFQRIGYGLAELIAGLGLGALPVVGITFVNLGAYDPRAAFASVPSGLLVMNLLLMNEFPDRAADATVGRRTLPVQIGWHGAAIVYTAALALTYLWIVAGVILRFFTPWAGLALATLPLGAIAAASLFGTIEQPRLLRGLGANVVVVLVTQLLMAAGLVIGRLN